MYVSKILAFKGLRKVHVKQHFSFLEAPVSSSQNLPQNWYLNNSTRTSVLIHEHLYIKFFNYFIEF